MNTRTVPNRLNFEESLETTKIHSVMGLIPPDSALIVTRPFRNPHHTISDAGLIGGGQIPKPARLVFLIMGSFSWTNCPNLRRTFWRSCVNLWKRSG
jgi:magnesium chelatase family protein